MTTRKRVAKPEPGSSQTDPAVAAFLRDLDHPLKREIEAVRQIILGASPEIREGIKWNSPSFRTKEYFATLNLRARGGKDRVWLILADEEITALVCHKWDGRQFSLGLADLRATDRKSNNYRLLDDYSVWFVNKR